MKEIAKQHYEKQLEELERLARKLTCYHVSETNRSNKQNINWFDCGNMGDIIEKLYEVVDIIEGTKK